MFNDIPLIVALDHPSLIEAIDQFADELHNEQRFFGSSAAPAPFPSLINRVTSHCKVARRKNTRYLYQN
jgi:tryptophan synthase beta subunit